MPRTSRNLSAHHPASSRPLIIDSDAYNQVDDLFAIAFTIFNPSDFEIQALVAAPFYRDLPRGNPRSCDPGDGMEKSYEAMRAFVRRLGRPELTEKVYRGASHYLPEAGGPDDQAKLPRSAGSDAIIELARTHEGPEPLDLVALACLTNVATALLEAPEIAPKLRILWLGGDAWHLGPSRDFNYIQDPRAVRIVCESSAHLVQFPCRGVVSEFRFTPPELRSYLDLWDGASEEAPASLPREVYRELLERYTSWGDLTSEIRPWSKPIWDVLPVLWLRDSACCEAVDVPARSPGDDDRFVPIAEAQGTYKQQTYVTYVWRDRALNSLLRAFSLLPVDDKPGRNDAAQEPEIERKGRAIP